MKKPYDLIVIGSGSIGVPVAFEFAKSGQSVLVIDSLASPGQGQDKKAIGGIRATHSDKGKIVVSQRSIDIFSTWKEIYGDDIQWKSNGYSFPAYTKEDETTLNDLMKIQKGYGLNINWLLPEEYRELNPGINMKGLRGSTYSPEDGSASPLLFINSCHFKAVEYGAEFIFNETITGFHIEKSRIASVRTNKGEYYSANVLNAAGVYARDISQMAGIEVPVDPDCHEAGITEPVKPFMGPMVVDMRSEPGSKNFYFYQSTEGQVIFCLTPDPPILGTDSRATSGFLPMIAKRMIKIMPMLANLKVRRTWRGQYPNSPDGFPIVGKVRELDNFYQAVGMCGQGFMLGPGMAELIHRLITESYGSDDPEISKSFDPYRDFKGKEVFK
ncbi:MAG: FAD-binding oxidoreductase [Desulfobacterales bacterium]|nr:FAD-binding oxidoreductase [Desulfobacterales bacterium]MDX2509902.1 FAD-binding oxidoreductase [Desulfobacterales bacterium]